MEPQTPGRIDNSALNMLRCQCARGGGGVEGTFNLAAGVAKQLLNRLLPT